MLQYHDAHQIPSRVIMTEPIGSTLSNGCGKTMPHVDGAGLLILRGIRIGGPSFASALSCAPSRWYGHDALSLVLALQSRSRIHNSPLGCGACFGDSNSRKVWNGADLLWQATAKSSSRLMHVSDTLRVVRSRHLCAKVSTAATMRLKSCVNSTRHSSTRTDANRSCPVDPELNDNHTSIWAAKQPNGY